MKRVLMIPTGGVGVDGITNVILNYVTYLDKNSYKVSVISPKAKCGEADYQKVKAKFEANACDVIDLFCRNNVIKYIHSLIGIMKKEEIEIVHIHGSSALMSIELIAAFLAGVKVRICHSHNTTCSNMKVHRLLKPLFDLLCNKRVACGELAGKWLFGDKDFLILTNGIDAERFAYSEEKAATVRRSLGLVDCKVLGHVGTFNAQKNQAFILDVFAELLGQDRSWRLVLVGDGELKSSVEDKARELGIYDQTLFLGRRLDAENIIQAMDHMILPSLHEGLPLVALEWQAAGLPIVVSDTVTSEIALTDLVSFMSLSDAPAKWAKRIIDSRHVQRNDVEYADVIKSSGYDIKENVKKLESLYR